MSESFGRGESALFLQNPELAAAARRQRLAQGLLEQAVKPRNVGGHAGGLAQMGQALIAGYMSYREDERIRAIADAQRAREDEEVRALTGGAMPAVAPGGQAPATESALATPPGSLPPPIPLGAEAPPMATALMNPPGQPAQGGGAAPAMPLPPPVPVGGPAPSATPAMAQPGGGVNMQAIIAGMSSSSPRVRATAQMLFQQARDQEERALRAQERDEERRFRLANRAPAEPRPVMMAPGQALVDPTSGRIIAERPATPAEPRQSDIERRIDLMVQNGTPREIAIGIATGQLETRQDPQDGSITIFDRSNGRILFGPNAGGVIGQPAAPAAPNAPLVQGPRVDGVAPGAPGSTFPPNADFRGATGAPGLIAETANLVADLFGGRNLPAPERAAGAQALRNLDTRTRMFLQSAIPGRPSNYLMEMIGGLTVSPAEIRMGPERATTRIQQTISFLDQTVRELEEIAGGQGTGRFTRQDIGEANRVLVSLRPLLNDYRTLEGAMTRLPDRAPPPPRRGTIGNRPAPTEGEIRTPSGLTLRPIQ